MTTMTAETTTPTEYVHGHEIFGEANRPMRWMPPKDALPFGYITYETNDGERMAYCPLPVSITTGIHFGANVDTLVVQADVPKALAAYYQTITQGDGCDDAAQRPSSWIGTPSDDHLLTPEEAESMNGKVIKATSGYASVSSDLYQYAIPTTHPNKAILGQDLTLAPQEGEVWFALESSDFYVVNDGGTRVERLGITGDRALFRYAVPASMPVGEFVDRKRVLVNHGSTGRVHADMYEAIGAFREQQREQQEGTADSETEGEVNRVDLSSLSDEARDFIESDVPVPFAQLEEGKIYVLAPKLHNGSLSSRPTSYIVRLARKNDSQPREYREHKESGEIFLFKLLSRLYSDGDAIETLSHGTNIFRESDYYAFPARPRIVNVNNPRHNPITADELRTQIAREAQQFSAFNEATNELANDNDWCEEYEQVIEALGMDGREDRKKDWNVTVRARGEVTLGNPSSRLDREIADEYDLYGMSASQITVEGEFTFSVSLSGMSRREVEDMGADDVLEYLDSGVDASDLEGVEVIDFEEQ